MWSLKYVLFCTRVYFERRPSLSTTHTTHHSLHYSAESVGRHLLGNHQPTGIEKLCSEPTPSAVMHENNPAKSTEQFWTEVKCRRWRLHRTGSVHLMSRSSQTLTADHEAGAWMLAGGVGHLVQCESPIFCVGCIVTGPCTCAHVWIEKVWCRWLFALFRFGASCPGSVNAAFVAPALLGECETH